jgi:hypothetical protein
LDQWGATVAEVECVERKWLASLDWKRCARERGYVVAIKRTKENIPTYRGGASHALGRPPPGLVHSAHLS